LTPCILAIFYAVAANAGEKQPFIPAHAIIADTSIQQNDTLVIIDPKLGFKNLFATAVTGDGVNGAKLNPLAISFVEKFISKNKKGMLAMKTWAQPHFEMMDAILEEHGVPKELKYLAIIESGLKYNAKSFSGAVGPWAFMPAAARQYGLRMSKGYDERLDYSKSTHAAARLLTDLYTQYGDWLLVIAAYNSGPGNVNKAIRNSGGTKDFWKLQYNLPNETMNHVKKFIATHYIFEGEGGITTLTKKETKDLITNASLRINDDETSGIVTHKITGRFNAGVILKYVEMDQTTFNRFNPGFDAAIANSGTYSLRLPTQQMNTFVAKRYQILDESMQLLLNSGVTGANK